MSTLAQDLLSALHSLGGPTYYMGLWEQVDADVTFDELQNALVELIDAGKIRQIDDTFAFELIQEVGNA